MASNGFPLQNLPLSPRTIALVAAGVALGWGASLLFRWWRTHRARKRVVQAVTQTGFESLRDVLVPDGNGGHYHVDFLLLTTRGILVVDLRDVEGIVFGGDQMTDWTVMNGPSRSTFLNPQGALYDRVAAVRALSGEVPVEGRIVFTRRSQFPKGLPKWTLLIDALKAEFPHPDRASFQGMLERFQQGWQAVKVNTSPSSMANPRPL